jgi:hypothetical protein
VDAGDRLAVNLVEADADELGDAQPCSEGQMQHRSIANAG